MRIGTYTLTKGRPAIMGVVNVTPDSFSDGGLNFDTAAAVSHALKLESEGADIIDIGGESSRPGSGPVPADEELRRVIPVIEGIRKVSHVPISIDTQKAAVADSAIKTGADMINDISADLSDKEMFNAAAEARVPLCLMHMRGTPETMQEDTRYDDLMGEIVQFLEEAVRRAGAKGVRRDKIIIDPGIGFGKKAEDNVRILHELRRLEGLGCPILIGTSKKSFIGNMLGHNIEKRLEATLASLAIAIQNGASILRVHDAGPARRFVDAYVLFSRLPASAHQSA